MSRYGCHTTWEYHRMANVPCGYMKKHRDLRCEGCIRNPTKPKTSVREVAKRWAQRWQQ